MKLCPNCRIRRLREVSLTFVKMIGSQLLVAPLAPANKCTVCQHVEFDYDFLLAINQMIAPSLDIVPNSKIYKSGINFQNFYSHHDNIKAM